jgi:hypothetical protein
MKKQFVIFGEALKSGASAETIAKKTTAIKQYKEMYKNPFLLVLLTLMEISFSRFVDYTS